MKSIFALLLACFGTISASAQEWLHYTSVDSSFSVYLPTLTYDRVDTVEQDKGAVIVQNVYAAVADTSLTPNDAFVVNVMSYPGPIDTTGLLLAVAEGITDQLLGREDYTAPDPRTGGLRVRISLDYKQQVCRLLTFVNGQRIYTLQVFTPLSHSLNDDTQYFFDSFKIH